jgi:hypothetical protein
VIRVCDEAGNVIETHLLFTIGCQALGTVKKSLQSEEKQ